MVRASELYNYFIKELKLKDFQNKESYEHITTVFQLNRKKLIFVGGPHTNGSSRYIKFLLHLLSSEKPEIILLEKPVDMTKTQLELHSLDVPKTSWDESDWAINFAKRHNIAFAGMDIKDSDILNSFITIKKEGIEIGIAFWIMLTYYSNKRVIRGLSSRDLLMVSESRVALDFLSSSGRFYNLRGRFCSVCKKYDSKSIISALEKILDNVVAKYLGKDPLPIILDKENLTAPYPFGSYKLNFINTRWYAYRDKVMIENCISALKKYKTVVALAGSGHIIEIREILERELMAKFGTVKSKRWDEL